MKKRFGLIRGMQDLLTGVVLTEAAGEKGYSGFRVVRILKAKYDRKLRQIIKLKVQLYGGIESNNSGFNGEIVTLTNRRSFVNTRGQNAKGIIVAGHDPFSVDWYAKAVLDKTLHEDLAVKKAESREEIAGGLIHIDTTKRLPLARIQTDVKPGLLESLAKLLQQEPKLLQRAELLKRWLVKCPDGSSLVFAGYGKPGKQAIELHLTGYYTDEKSRQFKNKEMPGAQVSKSIAELLKEYKAGSKEQDLSFEEDKPRLMPADTYDSASLPPLTKFQTKLQDSVLLKQLAELLRSKPELLQKSVGLPDEPRWDVQCPNGSRLDIGGYGYGASPVQASEMHLVGYTDAKNVEFMASMMPSSKVFNSIRELIKSHKPQVIKPPVQLPKLEDLKDEDDDYGFN